MELNEKPVKCRSVCLSAGRSGPVRAVQKRIMTLLSSILIAAIILASQNFELSKGDWHNSTQLHNAYQNDTRPFQNITNRPNQEQIQNHTDLPTLLRMSLHEHNIWPLEDKKEDNKTANTLQTVYGEPVTAESYGSYLRENKNSPFIAGGNTLTFGEPLPLVEWHVGVYSKAFQPYMQICGGTLVTTKAFISAAHCFWSELDGSALPASQFAAAAGKLYRPWEESYDFEAQQADISAIHLPARFRGATASFQDDIAAVLLAKEFVITYRVRPLCVRFDEDLEADILRSGNEGRIVGWGLTSEDGTPAQTLQSLDMPYVPIDECIASAEPSFLKYITSDKICAGVTTGKSLCRGDSGGGLVFFDHYDSQPLLYGVASTAPRNAHSCNTRARAALTRVLAHRAFLRTHILDIEACAQLGISSRFKADDEKIEVHQCPTQPVFNCNCYCNCNNSTAP
ncbi:prostasin-like [Cydia pomonella]|uniref:prostasin-like n=1 Tax=Cydia pomonella TaxID=82600 RepID=UPI002ADD94B5|nr:prostasin-like [Cydia pomonella]